MSKIFEVRVNDVKQLKELAGHLLNVSTGFKIIAFFGEMGAGKTTFIKEICTHLGISENVSSPTFSLINEYADKNGEKVFHFDFYRLNNSNEAIDIGCVEYFESGSLCLIEWPEKILNLLPHPLVKVEIEVINHERRFTFSYD